MADADGERLIAIFEARLADFERNMKKAPGIARQARQKIEREADQLTKNVETKMARAGGGFSGAFGMLRGALGVAGIGLGVGALANLTSEWSDLNSRVTNAVGSMRRGEEVMGRISEMARRSYSSLTQTAESFLQNADALTELGYNTTQQLNMTEALNNSLVISATRGQQAEAVMRAWSQALALGELRGDNLNTVIQNSSRLTRALAESMGVSVNSLRSMGAAGQITARDMMGVSSQLETLRAEADAMPATITDSFVLLGNAVMQFVGQFDQATGITSILAGEIIALADSIQESAQRWADRDVPILQFIDAAAELSRELGILREEIEDNRTELEQTEDAVADARFAFLDLASAIAMNSEVRLFAPDLPDQIQAVVDKLLLGEMSADDAKDALLELGQANLDFSLQIGQLAGLANEIRIVTTEAREMHAALNMPGGPMGDGAGRGGTGASRRARVEQEAALTAYIGERERVLGLSQQQLTLEQAIAREIKLAADEGRNLSAAEAERLARLQLVQQEAHRSSGKGGSNGAEDFAKEMAQIEQRTHALMRETALQATLNPLVNDYGYAVEKLRVQQELENAATKAGLALTPDRLAAIEKLAEGYAAASVEAATLAEAQDDARATMEDWFSTGRSVARGFIDDLVNAKSATEALGNAFAALGNKLIDLGLGAVFGTGQGANPFGLIGQMLGFAGGGYTGPGGRNQPAGIVHKGEVVWSQTDIARSGGVAAVEAMRRGVAVPQVPAVASDNAPSFTYAPQIDARGADLAAVARLEQVVANDRALFEGRVKQIVSSRGRKWR